MISMGSLSRRVSTEWPSTGGASFEARAAEAIDFHDYARCARDDGANFMLSKPCRSSWQLTRQPLAGIVLQSGVAGGATAVDGVSPSGSFVFFVRHSGRSRPITLNGETVPINQIAVLPPGKDFVLASQGSHKWISVTVPVSVLAAAGFSPAHIQALGTASCLIRVPRAAANQLVAAVLNAIDLAQNTPISANATRFRDIEQALLADLLAAVIRDDVVAHAPSHRSNRNLDRVMHQALAFLRTRDGDDLHVEHLCGASGVAERSLLRAFHRFFGIGPTQYLKLRRLNRVHCALQAPDGKESTVTGILTTCGVTEFGRFAGAYRALFGESPSETLRKKAGKRESNVATVDKSLRHAHAGLIDRQTGELAGKHVAWRKVVPH
jgi:AraC family transcriptional regulator, ethanolamine operon transcriptional activator